MSVAREIVEDWLAENWSGIKRAVTDEEGSLATEAPHRGSAAWIFWRAIRFYSGIDPSVSDFWGKALREWGREHGLPTRAGEMLEWERCMANAMKRMARELGFNPGAARRYWADQMYPHTSRPEG